MINYEKATLEIANHSNTNNLTELCNYVAFLNDKTTSELTNGNIKDFMKLFINTFETCVLLSKLHQEEPEEFDDPDGWVISGKNSIPYKKNSGVKSYFSIYLAIKDDKKTPYLIKSFDLTDKHKELLYEKLKLKVKEEFKDVVELTWN